MVCNDNKLFLLWRFIKLVYIKFKKKLNFVQITNFIKLKLRYEKNWDYFLVDILYISRLRASEKNACYRNFRYLRERKQGVGVCDLRKVRHPGGRSAGSFTGYR